MAAKLSDRLEVASGADRDLDAEIAAAVHFGSVDVDGRYWRPGVRGFCISARYTVSLDAAMTLAEGYVLLNLSDIGADGLPLARLGDPSTTPTGEWTGIAPTLPRAICAAALRARGL